MFSPTRRAKLLPPLPSKWGYWSVPIFRRDATAVSPEPCRRMVSWTFATKTQSQVMGLTEVDLTPLSRNALRFWGQHKHCTSTSFPANISPVSGGKCNACARRNSSMCDCLIPVPNPFGPSSAAVVAVALDQALCLRGRDRPNCSVRRDVEFGNESPGYLVHRWPMAPVAPPQVCATGFLRGPDQASEIAPRAAEKYFNKPVRVSLGEPVEM